MFSIINVPGGLHATSFHLWIRQVLWSALKLACGGLIQFGGAFHGQSLVRTLLIKSAAAIHQSWLVAPGLEVRVRHPDASVRLRHCPGDNPADSAPNRCLKPP